MSERPIYPPPRHVLRDLGLAFPFAAAGESAIEARLDVTDDLLDRRRSARIGFLATCCDLVTGQLARSRVAPDWQATADLELHLLQPVAPGRLRILAQVLREGRSAVISRVELLRSGDGERLAVGSVAFTRLPRREDSQPSVVAGAKRSLSKGAGSGGAGAAAAAPGRSDDLLARIGVEIGDSGDVRLALHDYVRNSLGGLQGGLAALLLELAAERCAASTVDGASAGVGDLFVRYLNVGRVGPFCARARLLREKPAGALIEAEVLDLGADERSVAVGTALAFSGWE